MYYFLYDGDGNHSINNICGPCNSLSELQSKIQLFFEKDDDIREYNLDSFMVVKDIPNLINMTITLNGV